MWHKLIHTDLVPKTLLIRLMVGAVFLSEGVQKFLFPAVRGAGRFEKIGLPEPEILGYFVGSFEVLCGLLLLLGLLTRLAAIPLIIIMLVAIATTKTAVLANEGFWAMLHGSRTDWAMLLGSIFLLIKGGGRWSADLLYKKVIAVAESKSGMLQRDLGLFDAVGVGLGAVIGAGIFVVSGVAAGVAGPAFLLGLFGSIVVLLCLFGSLEFIVSAATSARRRSAVQIILSKISVISSCTGRP